MGHIYPLYGGMLPNKRERKRTDGTKKEPFTLASAKEMRRNPNAAMVYLSLFAWVIIIIFIIRITYDFIKDEVEDYNEYDENNPNENDPREGGRDGGAGGDSAGSSTMSPLCFAPPCPQLHVKVQRNGKYRMGM
ncbi:hypothetical protein Tco_0821537 [Tanacetum coccineum]|uniref:Uncharacterized protein n=1 Tax=Tanacetum coccineum TaxID=301880 RepID=A0ABQ5ADI0_9ASTR